MRRPGKRGPAANKQGTLARAVKDVIEVVPGPVKVALAVLAALLLAAGAAVGLGRRHRKALLGEVEVLQAALVPSVPQRLNGLALSAAYRPAEGPGAGGDFYDVFALDQDRVAIVLGDVCGHGREAVGRSTSMRFTLHAYLEAGLDPRSALRLAGEKLESDAFEFATVVLAVHDSREGTLTYASAAHPHPIILGPSAWEPPRAAASPPIGIGEPTGLSQTTVVLPRDAVVCFFTDGLEEARRGAELLGRERLQALVAALGPHGQAVELLEAVQAAADRAPDDLAALIVRTESGPRTADLRVEELELVRTDVPRAKAFLAACGAAAEEASRAIDAMHAVHDAHDAALMRVTVSRGAGRIEVLPPASPRAAQLAVDRPRAVAAA